MSESEIGAVSRAAAAALYEINVNTISRAINAGELPAKKVGRLIRIDRADLKAWFESLPDA